VCVCVCIRVSVCSVIHVCQSALHNRNWTEFDTFLRNSQLVTCVCAPENCTTQWRVQDVGYVCVLPEVSTYLWDSNATVWRLHPICELSVFAGNGMCAYDSVFSAPLDLTPVIDDASLLSLPERIWIFMLLSWLLLAATGLSALWYTVKCVCGFFLRRLLLKLLLSCIAPRRNVSPCLSPLEWPFYSWYVRKCNSCQQSWKLLVNILTKRRPHTYTHTHIYIYTVTESSEDATYSSSLYRLTSTYMHIINGPTTKHQYIQFRVITWLKRPCAGAKFAECHSKLRGQFTKLC